MTRMTDAEVIARLEKVERIADTLAEVRDVLRKANAHMKPTLMRRACGAVLWAGQVMTLAGVMAVSTGRWHGWVLVKAGAGLWVIAAAYKVKVLDAPQA